MLIQDIYCSQKITKVHMVNNIKSTLLMYCNTGVWGTGSNFQVIRYMVQFIYILFIFLGMVNIIGSCLFCTQLQIGVILNVYFYLATSLNLLYPFNLLFYCNLYGYLKKNTPSYMHSQGKVRLLKYPGPKL